MSRCLMQVYCIHVIDMLHLNITNMDEKKCTLYLINNFWFPSLHYPFLNEEQIIQRKWLMIHRESELKKTSGWAKVGPGTDKHQAPTHRLKLYIRAIIEYFYNKNWIGFRIGQILWNFIAHYLTVFVFNESQASIVKVLYNSNPLEQKFENNHDVSLLTPMPLNCNPLWVRGRSSNDMVVIQPYNLV